MIAKYPDFGNAYLNLGLLLLKGKQQLFEARTIWRQLMERCPEHPAAEKAQKLLLEHM